MGRSPDNPETLRKKLDSANDMLSRERKARKEAEAAKARLAKLDERRRRRAQALKEKRAGRKPAEQKVEEKTTTTTTTEEKPHGRTGILGYFLGK